MKKVLIIGSIFLGVLMLAGAGMWAYVLISGKTLSVEEVDPFGVLGEESEFSEMWTENFDDLPTKGEEAARKIRQISTRLSAGAVVVDTEVRFAERGTGHLYARPLSLGEEVRLSNKTYPRTTSAVWSESGTRVAITYESENGNETIVGSIGKNDTGESVFTEEVALPLGAHSIAFTEVGDSFFYAVSTTEGTTGYEYALKTDTKKVAFTSPLSEVRVDWRREPLIVTKPALTYGSAYRADVSKVAGGANGFLAFSAKTADVATYNSGNAVTSEAIAEGERVPLGAIAVPEKCAEVSEERLVCGVPKSLNPKEFPLSWYRGALSYEDAFYAIDLKTGAAILIVDPDQGIDTVRMNAGGADTLVFENRKDGTLWVLEP